MSAAVISRCRVRSTSSMVVAALGLLLGVLVLVGPDARPAKADGPVFTVPASGTWDVSGAGYGHGIGMSQWGAQGAALAGLRPDQILGFYYPGTVFGNIGNPNVRVQLTSYQGVTIVFGAYGNETLTATDRANDRSETLPKASRYRLTIDGTWMHLDQLVGGGTWQPLTIQGQTNIGGPIDIDGPSGTWLYSADLSGAGRQYWGTLRFVRSSASAAQAVNVLTMDAYLKFVVPRESPAWFETNALQSQAVAARSYARSVSTPSKAWDICDTTACQVYGGRAVAAAGGAVTWLESASTSSAVDGTSGVILAESSGGAAAFTQFSASNGGYSVAGSKPYLVAKEDPYSGRDPHDTVSRWTDKLSASAVEQSCPSGTLQSFEVTGRDGKGPFGGRITSIKVNCTGGSANVTSTSALSFGMKSRMWTVTGATDGGGGGGSTLAPERIGGADRIATALLTSQSTFPAADSASAVVLASSENFPDGLAGTPLAQEKHAPLLLTGHAALRDDVLTEIRRVAPDGATVYALGGTAALGDPVANAITAAGFKVQRLAGDTRYATAAAIADAITGRDRALLTTGLNFPDALAAGVAAAKIHGVVLFTADGTMPPETQAWLSGHQLPVTVVGGPAANAMPSAEKVAGADRYETAVKLAQQYFGRPTVAGLASGTNFPDALSGGAHVAAKGGPILLTPPNALPATLTTWFGDAGSGLEHLEVYGGEGAISAAVLQAAKDAIG
jgi:SpoIID/LytB domain protein